MNVAHKYPPLEGWLSTKDASHRIRVLFASRFTLWAVFDEIPLDLLVENLDVHVDGRVVCLGPCRTLSEFDKEEQVIWLLPSQTFYDLELLFMRQEVKPLPLELSGLHPPRDYRQGIDPLFCDFVADLTCEMNDMMAHLDRMDALYSEEPPLVQSVLQSNLIARAGPRFEGVLNTWNQKLIQFVALMSKVERDHCGIYFRLQVWSILLRAPFLAQSNMLARHEAVDSEAHQMVYRNNYEGNSTFGKLLHKYAVGLPAAQAARNVQHECADILQTCLQNGNSASDSKYRVLVITKGMPFEWLERLQSPVPFHNLVLTLLDPDSDTQILAEAAPQIKKMETNLGTRVQVNHIVVTIGDLTEPEPVGVLEKVFDFICSFGLLDSQIDMKARAILRTLYRWLRPGGEMVLTNAAADNPGLLLEQYWNDRRRHNRTEQQCLDLVSDLTEANSSLFYDETKIEMLLRVNKSFPDYSSRVFL